MQYASVYMYRMSLLTVLDLPLSGPLIQFAFLAHYRRVHESNAQEMQCNVPLAALI